MASDLASAGEHLMRGKNGRTTGHRSNGKPLRLVHRIRARSSISGFGFTDCF
jgi:hypothetical protein